MKTNDCKINANNISTEKIRQMEELRKDFPILNSNIVYLDSAATSQKPQQVIDEINKYYLEYCSNIGRGNYDWARKANKKVEETIHTIGFILIMLLMIYVFYNDIMRIVNKFM